MGTQLHESINVTSEHEYKAHSFRCCCTKDEHIDKSLSVHSLATRMKRFPSERLHDEVDRELLKEREAFEGVVSLLQRVVEQIIEQIR